MICQYPCGMPSDVANTEAVDEPIDIIHLTLFDGVDEILSALFSHPLQILNVTGLQTEYVPVILYQTLVNKLIGHGLAHAFDVHGVSRREVEDALLYLGRATYINAFHRYLARLAGQLGKARRAL